MNEMLDIAELFEADVAVAAAFIDACDQPLLRDEHAAIENACPSRAAEFRAGRQCARLALQRLGCVSPVIPSGVARQPCWPPEFVGSISHSDRYCVSAVAQRVKGYEGIGVDVEAAGELDETLIEFVCTAAERAALGALSPQQARLQAKSLFSIKESVFKCQFPITGAWLEFVDLEIGISSDRRSFEAAFLRNAGPLRRGYVIPGRLRERLDVVWSSAWLARRSDPLSA